LNSDSLRLSAIEAQVRRQPRVSPGSSGPTFLDHSVNVLTKSTTTVAWKTFNAGNSIPAGASTAIVETEWSMSSPDTGDVDAYIRFRRDIDSAVIVGSRGRASGASDNIAGANQVMVPITANRSFDFSIETPGFNNGATIRLVGYFA
jgi:hypothetical protein